MPEGGRQLCVKLVVYTITVLNLVGGVIYIVGGLLTLSPLRVVQGVFSVVGAALLLLGIFKDEEKYVLGYLITEVLLLSLATVGLFAGLVKGIFFVNLIVLIILWLIQICVYLYYKDMVHRHKQAAVNAGNAEITYNANADGQWGEGDEKDKLPETFYA